MSEQKLGFYVQSITPSRTGGSVHAELLETHSERLWSLYDRGMKFFDREQLCRVGDQVEEANRSKEQRPIVVVGLDGVPVNFDSHVGFRGYIPASEQYINYVRAQVFYRRISDLERLDRDHSAHICYCPLQIKHIAQVEGTASVPPRLPTATAERCWNNSLQSWEASETLRLLTKTLKSINLSCKLSKITAFALGSVTADYRESEVEKYCAGHRIATQHAFVGTLCEALREHAASSQLPCYVQDPDYNDVDKRLMGELGLNAVDDPDGLLEIDDHSVVVSMCASFPIDEIVHDLAKPAVIIWEPHHQRRTIQDDSKIWGSRVGTWLAENYDEVKLEFLDRPTFSGLTCYVRKQ